MEHTRPKFRIIPAKIDDDSVIESSADVNDKCMNCKSVCSEFNDSPEEGFCNGRKWIKILQYEE